MTGNPGSDSDHRLLLNAMARLREVCVDHERRADCASCAPARAAACNRDLVDTLGELLACLIDHFFAEERAMRKLGLSQREKELCDRHVEDHALISDTVLRIVAALDSPRTVVLIRQLHSVLGNWVKHHIELHDMALLRILERS
ncbi:MAG TPA: hemerythrin family protein [Rhodocyclaceae bacterium]|nr:hemerythrin family protein [Rhodocyclaceae bacterium]